MLVCGIREAWTMCRGATGGRARPSTIISVASRRMVSLCQCPRCGSRLN